MTAHDNWKGKKEVSSQWRLRAWWPAVLHLWKILEKAIIHDDSSVILRKTKQSFPLLSSKQEAGVGLIAQGVMDLDVPFIFNYFSLTFCIILHKRNSFYFKFPQVPNLSLTNRCHPLALQLATGQESTEALTDWVQTRIFLGTFHWQLAFN